MKQQTNISILATAMTSRGNRASLLSITSLTPIVAILGFSSSRVHHDCYYTARLIRRRSFSLGILPSVYKSPHSRLKGASGFWCYPLNLSLIFCHLFLPRTGRCILIRHGLHPGPHPPYHPYRTGSKRDKPTFWQQLTHRSQGLFISIQTTGNLLLVVQVSLYIQKNDEERNLRAGRTSLLGLPRSGLRSRAAYSSPFPGLKTNVTSSCALNTLITHTTQRGEYIRGLLSHRSVSLTKRSLGWSRTSVEPFIKDFEYRYTVGKSSQYHAQVCIVERALVGTKFDQLGYIKWIVGQSFVSMLRWWRYLGR